MVRHGGSSAGSYFADPTSPIPSHCASIVATSTFRVNVMLVVPSVLHCSHSNSISCLLPTPALLFFLPVYALQSFNIFHFPSQENYFNMTEHNPAGCSPCECDVGGALSASCPVDWWTMWLPAKPWRTDMHWANCGKLWSVVRSD